MTSEPRDATADFLDLPAVDRLFGAHQPEPGEQIGHYRLVRLVSRGEMGWVYEAVRDDDLQRRVAIKLLPRVPGRTATAARFLAERRMLARLEHPGIARLYDGGTTHAGLPFFVMEWVEGEPVDLYCDRRRVSIRDRIELVLRIAEAVRHAHQNLIVHRDLKPTNILVDDRGQPKLLDFGIAKLLAPALETPGDAHGTPEPITAPWMRVLTPNYASPEQLRGEPVTTASDVYSLGVLLYRLLTGSLPREVEGTSIAEILHRLETRTPPAPSARVDGAPASIAAARQTTPRALRRTLNGDLDAIVLTALRARPEDRYRALDPMIEDLRRYLANRPVRARGNALTYRLAKGMRRYRAALGVGSVVVAILVAAAIGRELQTRQIERQRAEQQQVAELLIGLFDSEGAAASGAADAARELLERGADRLESKLENQPRLEAAVLGAIGRGYSNLGLAEEAVAVFRRAVRLREAGAGSAAELAEALHHLGVALRENADYEGSSEHLSRALELRLALGDEGDADAARTRLALAALKRDRGDYLGASTLARRALVGLRKAFGEASSEVAHNRALLAVLALESGDLANADEELRAAIRTFRDLEEQGNLAMALTRLSIVRLDLGRPDEAADLAREALGLRRSKFGDDHPLFDESRHTLALALSQLGDHSGAESLLRRTERFALRHHGPQHPAVARARFNLGTALEAAGRYDEALEALLAAIRTARSAVGNQHPRVATAVATAARLRTRLGDLPAAHRDFEQSLAVLESTVGEGHPFSIGARLDRARLRRLSGDPRAALDDFQRDLPRWLAIKGPNHADVYLHRLAMAQAFLDLGRADEARPLLRQAIPGLKTRYAAGSPVLEEARAAWARANAASPPRSAHLATSCMERSAAGLDP